jgi:transcriptional regulator with XRE-family HTH domain
MIPMDRKRPVDSHIGQRLKEYRQHRGMTVRELADAAHVTPGQISHYEHGRDRISHERVTEFARILRIKSNDLYQPPGSRLRHNHVRWRLTNFMAAVIAEAAALMSSRRKVAAAADNEMLALSTAVAVAVSASAAAASSGEKISSLTSGDDAAVDISGVSWSGAAWRQRMAGTVTDNERVEVVEDNLEIADFAVPKMQMFKADAEAILQIDPADAANTHITDGNTDAIDLPGHYTEINTTRGKVSHDRLVSAPEETSGQSSSAENGTIESNPSSGNGNHASDDPKIGDVAKVKDQPAQSDNFKFNDEPGKHKSSAAKIKDDDADTGKDKSSVAKIKDDDGEHATGKDKSADNDHHASADPKSSDSALGGLLPQSDNFKFADESNPGKASHDAKEIGDTKAAKDHPAHPHSENFKFKFADNAHPGNDKLDMIETDRTVTADIQHLLHTAHDANAVSALDPTTAPQETTKAHHADLHFA